jgi:hypothetical protein
VSVIAADRIRKGTPSVIRVLRPGDLIADIVVEAFDAHERAVVLPLGLSLGDEFSDDGIGIPSAEIDVAIVGIDVVAAAEAVRTAAIWRRRGAAAIGGIDLRAALLGRSDADTRRERRGEGDIELPEFVVRGAGRRRETCGDAASGGCDDGWQTLGLTHGLLPNGRARFAGEIA